jgi:hypothetical protein
VKFFLWWLHDSKGGLEQAKRDEAEADKQLREAKENSLWARHALDRNGFADALVHIIQGGHP